MIKKNVSISEVKELINKLYLKSVCVSVDLGRNKRATFEAKLTGVYPALFTVSPTTEFKGKTSYSYSEYMCGKVILKEKINV